jgi:hypothetical protein
MEHRALSTNGKWYIDSAARQALSEKSPVVVERLQKGKNSTKDDYLFSPACNPWQGWKDAVLNTEMQESSENLFVIV